MLGLIYQQVIKQFKQREGKHKMKANQLNNSLWALDGDMIHVSKKGRGYYGIGNKFDFERANAKETIAQLKKWGYEHIGHEERNIAPVAEIEEEASLFDMETPVAWEERDEVELEEIKAIEQENEVEPEQETMEIERAMSVKNPTVKKYLAEGWAWVGKEWNGEKNMYIATLVKGA